MKRLTLVLLAACAPQPQGPVFPGHPMLSTYTKELALESSVAVFGDGHASGAAGAAVSAFYRPWLSFLGGATFSFGGTHSRRHYDTRVALRIVYPEPIFGRVFPFALGGVTVFFPETAPRSNTYDRQFGFVLGGGAFVQVTPQTRVRIEVRDAWLPASAALPNNLFVTAGLVYVVR